jgi:ribulose-5-phosphate 4-epimerase/fuculose-1-phosphate aldolase/alpha-ketoglutarate-dependent taurine dioxygenase
MKQKNDALAGLINIKPKSIKIDPSAVNPLSSLDLGKSRLATFQANRPIDIVEWTDTNKVLIDEAFSKHGALLFRGFALEGEKQFNVFTQHLSNELMDYSEPSTPRSKVVEKVYTSTEYPKEQFIAMHNEHSYSNSWPHKIWFYCSQAPLTGGETPIADSRRVYETIDPAIREEFIRKGVMYVRNFSNDMDLPWTVVFQTDKKEEAEAYCRKANITFEWKADGNLRTKQVCQAAIQHPKTQEWLWFNQAHLFHVSNLDPSIQSYLMEQCGEANLPRNTYFGDGTPIPMSYLQEIRNAYELSKMAFPWKEGDVLMLDNMLYAHGRNPFDGPRKILVAMAEPIHYQYKDKNKQADALNTSYDAVATARKNTAQFFSNQQSDDKDHALVKYKLAAAYRIMVSESLDEGGISGHISMRVPGEPESFWVNPFGLLADEVTPDNLIKVDKTGKILEGDYPANVAGFCIHAAIHEAYPAINCVVHTHSPWGTLFTALDRKVEAIDQNCCLFFENQASYDQFNGPVNDAEDAIRLAKALDHKDVILLRNHGSITCGNTIEAAVVRMVALEKAFRLNVLSLQVPDIKLIAAETARLTRDWIGNDMAFAIEFNALLRKAERVYPELKKFRPQHFKSIV